MDLSLIIPVYNVERYLPMCLESVVQQGLDDYEAILVDDGSTDGSSKICDEYAARYPQFRVIHQENQGVALARNRGISEARGEYILFLDSDDFLVPESIGQVLANALQHEVDIACFGSISGEREELTARSASLENKHCGSSRVMNGDEYIATHNFLATVWWYIIKREYLQSLNLLFPQGRRLEDGCFTPFVLLHAKRIIHIDAIVYCYVRQHGSIMHNKDRQRNFEMLSDYAFAAKTLSDGYERNRGRMSAQTSGRWMGLANSYSFFGLLKALRLGEAKYMIKHLKSQKLYPFEMLYEVDYPGKKWKLLHWLMNHERIWRAFSLLFKIIRPFR